MPALLSEALRRHAALPFPDHPDDDALHEWCLQLLEIDGHVVGLAHTALAGGDVRAAELACARDLRAAFDRLPLRARPTPAMRSCRAYLESLERLVAAMAA